MRRSGPTCGPPCVNLFPAAASSPTGPSASSSKIGELLAGLDKLDASDPEFEELLTAFTRAARAHFDFEEGQVWPRLRAVLTMKAATEMGRKILQGRQAAVALPRPRASAWPGGTHYGSFG